MRRLLFLLCAIGLGAWSVHAIGEVTPSPAASTATPAPSMATPAPSATPAPEVALPPVGLRVGETAPDFSLGALEDDGDPVRLSDFRADGERPAAFVLLNFWASWCGPCRAETRDFTYLHDDYSEFGLVILGVNVNDDLTDARQFARRLEVAYPNVVDSMGLVQRTYAVEALPTSFLLDARGVIVERFIGAVDYETLAPLLDEAFGL